MFDLCAVDYDEKTEGYAMKKISCIVLAITCWSSAAIPAVYTEGCNRDGVASNAPNSRYIDNGDSTVTDNITGLTWKQCSEGLSTTVTPCDTGAAVTYTWSAALQAVDTINNDSGFAGYTDWRLPNIKELASLAEHACYYPSINTTLFPNTEARGYRSSSPTSGSPLTAWIYHFANGGTNSVDQKTTAYYVRLVRGGL